ncbi:MAG: LamG-like jellyroll fold domain-containing protein, partial [Candidatus Desantisbacteria bacterium]
MWIFTLLSTLSYAQEYTTDSNTVALWHFNEGSGSLTLDETGRFNGTVNGAAWTTGKYGNALSFNGVTNSVTISSNLSEGITSQMTAEAWIYTTKTEGRIVGRYSREGLSYLLTLEGGKIAFYVNSPSYTSAGRSTSSIPLNTWTHVAATYDGSTIRTYINGVMDSTTPKSLGNIISTTIPITIGASSYPDIYFGGFIDEVRISNIARTEFNVQTENQTNQTDITLPTVSVIHSPTLPVENQTVIFNATATDNIGVASVNIYVDDANVKTCNNLPCTYSSLFPTGTHTYYATASDAAGNVGRDPSSETKNFTILNCTYWTDAGCGVSPCSPELMKQIRNCTGYTNESE